jgi:magnesium transporter
MLPRTGKSRESMRFSTLPFSQVASLQPLLAALRLTCILGFVIYSLIVIAFTIVMVYKVAPLYGKKNPLVYLSICSTVGSLSIMAIKGFGIAVKLTMGGSNQFIYPSTYVFMIIMTLCILTQMNYFNKALSQFSTNM